MKFGILIESFPTNQIHLPSHHLRNKLEYLNRSKLNLDRCGRSLTDELMAHFLTD